MPPRPRQHRCHNTGSHFLTSDMLHAIRLRLENLVHLLLLLPLSRYRSHSFRWALSQNKIRFTFFLCLTSQETDHVADIFTRLFHETHRQNETRGKEVWQIDQQRFSKMTRVELSTPPSHNLKIVKGNREVNIEREIRNKRILHDAS